jgi:glycosyltransferase involved in cell wall biosynthesis
MFYFVFNAIPKRVIIQSPPLLVAFTSIFFLRSRHRKLVLNVSDLWPDAALNLGAVKEGLVYSTLKRMESFNYRNAHLILGQSNEILQHVKRITVYPKLMLYRNFPRIKIMDDASKPPKTSYTIRIVYAGLIGVAQGVVELCQHLNFQGIEFHIYGSGPETASLKAFIASHPNLPILYHGRIERQALHRKLMTYDVAIVPLVKRIYGSVPSKIFELAALGIPMIYFGGGEGEGIVSDHALGWVVNPQDYKQLNATIQEEVKPNLFKFNKSSIRAISLKHFNYDTQLQELKKELL